MKRKPVIAIIDSGLSSDFEEFNKIKGGVSFFIREDCIFRSDLYEDECGHGTNCAYIISKYCKDAILYIIKIIDATKGCNSVLLLNALEHLEKVKVDIINISLSVWGEDYKEEISQSMYRLKKQGKIIVSSVCNGKDISFPAEDGSCIGVRGKNFIDNVYCYNQKKQIQVLTNLSPEWAMGMKQNWNWFGGNSKAAAYISAVFGSILAETPSFETLEEIEEQFYRSSRKEAEMDQLEKKANLYLETNKQGKFDWNNSREKVIFLRIKSILGKYVSESDITINSVFWKESAFEIMDTHGLLQEIEQQLSIVIPMQSVKIENFINVKSLVWFINKIVENTSANIG